MKLKLGVGYNSKGIYKAKEAGKNTVAYNVWNNMLKRCYNKSNHQHQPTYTDCTVHPDWHDFQVFAKWFSEHKYSDLGYQLDKDLLFEGNKIYSPDFCCFVPAELNSLLTSCSRVRGEYPQGVNLDKRCGKYQAKISLNGIRKNLGHFSCPQEAYEAYKTTKEAYVKERALHWRDRIAPEVFDALMAWKL